MSIFDANRWFSRLMEDVVLPAHAANPTHVRLDGREYGGNRDSFATFWHQGRTWTVHADTHYDRLLEAWEAIRRGVVDPFEMVRTRDGGWALDLTRAARNPIRRPRPKHLYIYALD